MDPLQQAKSLLAQGRDDLAAVFFAAASQAPDATPQQRLVARRNAAVLAARVSGRAFGVPFAELLADPRQEAVCQAVSEASAGGRRVLILGSALGLYAVAAKRAGASAVVCVEANAFFEYAATAVVRAHGLEDVEVSVTRPPCDPAPEAGPRFDVLVAAEPLWGNAMSTSGVQSVFDAFPLLAPLAQVIPCSASVCAQAIESDTLRDRNWLCAERFEQQAGLDYAKYNADAGRSRLACHLNQYIDYRPVSSACEWLVADFQQALSKPSGSAPSAQTGATIRVEVQRDGHIHCVATWISLRLSAGGEGGEVISWDTGSTGGTGWQYCHYSDVLGGVSAGEAMDLAFTLGPDGVRLAGPTSRGDSSELSAYHTCMLTGDPQRTRAYRVGIGSSVESLLDQRARRDDGDGALHVLDIGAGTGLLSMFAAGAGATVVACERAASTAALAEKLVEANGFAGSIRVMRARSTDLSVEKGDLPAPQLVVSEIFGSDPLSEGVLATLKHAEEKLRGVEMPRFLPCQCRVWGSVARVPAAWVCHSEEASACGVEFGHLAPFESGTLLVDLRTEFRHVELLTEPAVLVTHRLAPPITASGSCSVNVALLPEPKPLYKMMSLPQPGEESGDWVEDVLCLVMWFDADCSLEPSDDEETRFSTSPAVERAAHWTQFAQVLRDEDVDQGVWEAVSAGQGAVCIETSWQLDFTSFRIGLASAA